MYSLIVVSVGGNRAVYNMLTQGYDNINLSLTARREHCKQQNHMTRSYGLCPASATATLTSNDILCHLVIIFAFSTSLQTI
jgi:hypothetical protein